jgi:DNA-binding transcriptional LysR family regulator
MIDAELYRVFLTVGRCGNISTASRRLYVSQPAVSKSIQKLERLTDCTLFYRSSKGVRLTGEGRILFEYVQKGFEHLDTGERILEKIRNREVGLVRIGVSSTLCRHLLIPHLDLFHQDHPGIKINIVNRSSHETLQQLKEGMVDFCVVSRPEEQTDCICHELMEITDILVANQHIFSLLPSPLPVGEVSRYPLMMLEKGNATRNYLESFFRENGVSLQVENEISNMDFLVEFAKIGIGIAPVVKEFVLPELQSGVLQKIELQPSIPPRKVTIVHHRYLPLSTAAATFIGSMESGCPVGAG